MNDKHILINVKTLHIEFFIQEEITNPELVFISSSENIFFKPPLSVLRLCQ